MHFAKSFCSVCFGLLMAAGVHGAVVLEYNTTGTSGTAGMEPATYAATTVATGVNGINLTRGPGIGSANLANGFSANNWGATTGSGWAGSASSGDAITNEDYFQWGFTVAANHTVSLSTLDLALRRSAVAAPHRYELYASTDGFSTAGTPVASWGYYGRSSSGTVGTIEPYQWMTTDTPIQGNGNPIAPQDLSGVALLQDIAPNTTVTFRLFGWYDGTGSPAASNTVALGRASSVDPVTSGGPSLGGTVTLVPEPGVMGLVGVAGLLVTARRRRA